MRFYTIYFFIFIISINSVRSQSMVASADKFINTLDTGQRSSTLYPFGSEERLNFHYFPINDRKGLSLNEMSAIQKKDVFALIKTCLAEGTIKKVKEIIELENILKELEQRKPEDHYRDPGNYRIAIFGIPGDSTIWGWRFEGHHVSFHFSASDNKLVAGTPGFLGANPAIVQDGPHKGEEVLKEEKAKGFSMLRSLTPEQLKEAIIDSLAPNEIVTGINRRAMNEHPSGVSYKEMSPLQRQKLLDLVSLYIHRYKKILQIICLKKLKLQALINYFLHGRDRCNPAPGTHITTGFRALH